MSQGTELLVDWDENDRRNPKALTARTLRVGDWIKIVVALNDDGEDGYGNYTPPYTVCLKIASVVVERRYGNKDEHVYLHLDGKIKPYDRYCKHDFTIEADMKYKRYKGKKVRNKDEFTFTEVTTLI